jgi:hypothetical protein
MSGIFDHTHASRRHWWIVVTSGLLTLICGTIGGVEYVRSQNGSAPLTIPTFLGAAYGAVQMIVLHAPYFEGRVNAWMESGRWLGLFTIVSTTWFLLWNRLQHEFRLMRLAQWNNHCVICGLGHKGMAIVDSIKSRDLKARIVVIDPSPNSGFVERCEDAGVCVIRMDATHRKALSTARAALAGEIIVVTVDDEINIRCAVEVRRYRQEQKSPHAFCHVHIANSYLPETLQQWTDAGADSSTTIRYFDVYDNEARRVLLNGPQERQNDPKGLAGFAPIDGFGIGVNDARIVHVIVLGMGRMGSSLVLRAAKMGHFANGKLLRISVIDRDADRQREQLLFRFPVLATANEVCNLEMHQWQADSLEARRFIELAASEPNTILHVFVCLDSNARAVEVGLRLWEIIKANRDGHLNIRIKSRASLASILENSGSGIRAFGMLEDTCSEEAFRGGRNEAMARGIHDDFVVARGPEGRRKDDPALKDWDHLREDFRESNRQQGDHMAIKLRAIGCRIVEATAPGEAITEFSRGEVELLAELEHRRWNAERRLSGWNHGTFNDPNQTKDSEKRVSKWLIPWKELPNEIKEYDRETVRKIPGWLGRAKPAMKAVRG